jgi:hypothetical protein
VANGSFCFFGGVFTFIGAGSISLSVVWGGSGANVVLGVLWLVVAAFWFGAALQHRHRERSDVHGGRRH